MNKKDQFIEDSKTKVMIPSTGARSIDYADGNEHIILEKVKRSSNVSVLSDTLYPFSDWSEEYHLSPERSNLLRPLDHLFTKGKRVLELGAGCGAITRYIGECGCEVTAVEGSINRAEIARERCRDLPNVEIFCSNFQNIDFSNQLYDIVTLIGVMEYAPLFFSGNSPVEECLNLASRHCHDKSVLIVAIENQLGLKYFNGMAEDHVGLPYFGVSDYYQLNGKTAQTFTKTRLEELLKYTNLNNHLFLYPFPDYKIPKMILTDNAFTKKDFDAYQLINSFKSRDYSRVITNQKFHEASVFKVLAQENIAGSFSNSFLILASKSPLKDFDWLAKIYSTHRRIDYCIETSFINNGSDISVTKRVLNKDNIENNSMRNLKDAGIKHNPKANVVFINGTLLSYKIERVITSSPINKWSLIKDLLVEWISFLKSNCINNTMMMPGNFFDAIPSNLIINKGKMIMIDDEWIVSQPINILFPIIRGIISTFNSIDINLWLEKMPHSSIRLLIKGLSKETNIQFNNDLIDDLLKRDGEIHEYVYPYECSRNYHQDIKRFLDMDLRITRIKNKLKRVFIKYTSKNI